MPARGSTSTAGASGWLVGVDEAQRLVAGVDELDARTTMLWNGLRHDGPSPASRGRLAGERRQPVEVEAEARERADEVGAAVPQPRVERVRVLDVLLDEVLVVLGDRDVEPAVETMRPSFDRVLVRVARARRARSPRSKSGNVEAGRPAHGLERGLARPLERLDAAPRSSRRVGAR